MNPSVNRSSESPHPLDKDAPLESGTNSGLECGKSSAPESVLSKESKLVIRKYISSTSKSSQEEPSIQSQSDQQSLNLRNPEAGNLFPTPACSEDRENDSAVLMSACPKRKLPIPAPSQPQQYRAIGLIQGHYQASSDHLTRGNLLTHDGTIIDAVILGRVISVLKKHLDLETPHLWVVYPRTPQDQEQLHVQIVGVWEPETLTQDEQQPDLTPQEQGLIKPGYFSIRGEVIFASVEKQTVIVKIKQAGKNEQAKPKFFKLNLTGLLPERPVSKFWDFQVQLQGNELVIQKATDLGLIKNKRPFNTRKKPLTNRGSRKPFTDSRLVSTANTEAESQQSFPKKFTPKPSKIIKKKID